jgi:hypothetical protein
VDLADRSEIHVLGVRIAAGKALPLSTIAACTPPVFIFRGVDLTFPTVAPQLNTLFNLGV